MITSYSRTESIARLSEIFNAEANLKIDTYALSMGYYLLTGRYGLVFYIDEAEAACVPLCVNPNDHSQILIFPEKSVDGKRPSYKLTQELLADLYWKGLSKNVVLARFSAPEAARLQGVIGQTSEDGVKRTFISKRTEFYQTQEPTRDILDWRYSIQILSTELYASLDDPEKVKAILEKHNRDVPGKRISELRRKTNKARKALEAANPLEKRLSFMADKDLFINAMKSCIDIWYQDKRWRDPTFLDDFYDALPAILQANPEMYDGIVVYANGDPAGFSIWHNTGDAANSLASLYTGDVPEMARYLNARSCEILCSEGIGFYNIGGSESERMHRTKRELLPVMEQRLASFEITFNVPPPRPITPFDLSCLIDQNPVKAGVAPSYVA